MLLNILLFSLSRLLYDNIIKIILKFQWPLFFLWLLGKQERTLKWTIYYGLAELETGSHLVQIPISKKKKRIPGFLFYVKHGYLKTIVRFS